MSEIKFGIIGCGRIGKRHAQHISNVGKLQAVCDIKEDKANELAESNDATAYYTVNGMLENEKGIDIIAICTPNGLHAKHSIQVLRAGYHVLCEKPMALSVADCGRMLTEAEKANKRLFVVKQNRFNPPIDAVKKLINEGRLGRLLSVQVNCFWNRHEEYYNSSDWKGSLELDGGTLFTQFSHFIDIMFWLAGDIENVWALTKNQNHHDTIEFEDTGVVGFEFTNGAIGGLSYTTNAYGGNMEGSITLFGTKGTVKIGGEYLNELEYQNIEGHEIKNLKTSAGANDYGTYKGSMSNHDKVYENIIEVFKNDGVATTVGYEGLKTVEIIEKIYSCTRAVKSTYEETER
ncbi:Gfo/Idh/MocA family protein [Fodinibius sp. AD559]|uniref:Gfo/Idh/MocA family protein n=1 Tax=Fodinibius sp. AD559 TaxID=3424179 RepID=UPI004046F059